LEDLCRRLDLQKVNRRVLEALLRAGSLDGLGANRATLMDRLSAAMHLGDQNSRAHAAGQNDLFGLASEERASAAQLPGPLLPEWSEAVRLAGERETLGLYLTGHPLARCESSLARFVSHRIGDLVSDRPVAGLESGRFGGGRPVTVAGLIDEVKKRGPRVILTLDDRTGRIEAMLFEETYQKHRDLISKDALVLVEGLLRFDEFSDAWRLAARRIAELEAKIEELRHVTSESEVNLHDEINRLQAKSRQLTVSIFANLTPWQITQLARHPHRPYTLDYVNAICAEFNELHGDRMYADDGAIVGGLARIDERALMIIGHQKGRDTKERVRRNYGMPKPEGYRKALRLMRLAERFGLPLLTLIDTQGAYPGVGAEERGQSEAIARNLFEMSV